MPRLFCNLVCVGHHWQVIVKAKSKLRNNCNNKYNNRSWIQCFNVCLHSEFFKWECLHLNELQNLLKQWFEALDNSSIILLC